MSPFTVKLIFVSSFLLIIGLNILHYRIAGVLLAQEKGKKPIYTIRCKAYFNWRRCLYTRFAIYDDFMVVSNLRKHLIKYEEIASVQKQRFLFSESLRIDHRLKSVPNIALYMENKDYPLKVLQQKIEMK